MLKLPTILTATALAGTLAVAAVAPAPALADGAASTRNIILGAAILAGIAIESNVASKNAKASTVEGYLPNGAVVYEDGHVQNPDGTTYYPGNQGEQIACNGQSCYVTAPSTPYNGYAYSSYAPNRYAYSFQNGRRISFRDR